MGAAIDYVQKFGIDNICRYELELLVYAMKELRTADPAALRTKRNSAPVAGVFNTHEEIDRQVGGSWRAGNDRL